MLNANLNLYFYQLLDLFHFILGVGKSTLQKKLLEDYGDNFGFSVSHTTRKPRPGEEDGVHYHYVTIENMEKAIANGEFIEHAVFAGRFLFILFFILKF